MRVAVLLACAVVIVPAYGHGQSEGDDKAAAEAFERGKELHETRNYVEAIEAFEVAYRLRPHHIVQCSIARCYENLNKPIEAAAHFKRCLADGAASTELGGQVRASLARMEARIVHVEVSSPGKGGMIHVDGRSRGEAPQNLRLNPGSHVIEVRREGAKAASATVKLLGGERRSVTLIPVDLQVEAPASSPTGAEEPRERPRRRLSQVWFWSAAGVTAALAITTTVLGIQTLRLKSDFEENPTEQGASDFWARRRLTNIMLGATLAAAATGTTLFFFTDFGGGPEPGTRGASAGIGMRGIF